MNYANKIYGCLKEIRTKSIYNLIEYLLEENILFKTTGLYPTVRVNENVLELNINIETVREILQKGKEKKTKKTEDLEYLTVRHGDFDIIVDEDGVVLTDISMLEDLRKIRMQISIKKAIAPFCVCSNKLLVRLATFKPKTREEFLNIKGIKDKWHETYAHLFIERIQKN